MKFKIEIQVEGRTIYIEEDMHAKYMNVSKQSARTRFLELVDLVVVASGLGESSGHSGD